MIRRTASALTITACGSESPTSVFGASTSAAGATTAARSHGPLADTQVRRNVQLSIDGSIIANGARISGSVQADDARRVVIAANCSIVGDVQVAKASSAELARLKEQCRAL